MCLICNATASDRYLASLDQHVTATGDRSGMSNTLDQLANYLTDGYWAAGGSQPHVFALDGSRTLTYDISGLSTQGQAIARAALEAWSAAAGITFVPAALAANGTAPGTSQTAQTGIDIAFDDQDPSGAYSYSEVGYQGVIQRSYINIADSWDTPNLTGYMLQTYIHEIGHALGLGHAGSYNGSATWGNSNVYDNDSWSSTVMSYFAQYMNPNDPASFAYLASVMPADVIAIQSLYGAANTTNTGNTTYGYNSTMGGVLQDRLNMWTGAIATDPFVFSANTPFAFTITDSTGIDTIDFSNFGVNQEITLIELSYSDIGGLIDNVAIARGAVIENATSGAGNDRLIGNAVANVLSGGAGNDSMDGAAGNDTFVGGTGGDAMNGGEGQDRAQYTDATAGLRADLQAAQLNTGFAAGDTYAGIEDLYGSSFGDTLLGDTGANVIWGDAGDDKWLDGRIGNDTLYGGAGNDVLVGGWGTDVLDGGVGSRDRAQYTDATAGLRADLQVTQFNTGIAAGDTYIGIEDLYGSFQGDTLLGDTGNNIIWGDAGDDKWLDGRIGNDTLYGGAGNDVLVGGQGADVLDGGVGSHDRAQYADANAGLRFDLQSNAANTGFAAGDTYTGIEDIYGSFFGDTLSGDAGANMIWGAAGNDLIDGRLGNDVLIGGAGHDTLTGGGGADVFLFESATGTTNVDSVTDYVVADDTVWLDDAIFAALTTGALSAAAFVTGSAATTASHRILYDAATGQLSYDADGTGATGPIHFATLSAGLAMTAAEFLVT